MVLAIPTLAELAGILGGPSERPLAALFLAMPPPPQGELVQLHKEVPALLMDLLDLFLLPKRESFYKTFLFLNTSVLKRRQNTNVHFNYNFTNS